MPSNNSKLIIVSGLSAIASFSAGVAFHYFYKRNRNRDKSPTQRSRRSCSFDKTIEFGHVNKNNDNCIEMANCGDPLVNQCLENVTIVVHDAEKTRNDSTTKESGAFSPPKFNSSSNEPLDQHCVVISDVVQSVQRNISKSDTSSDTCGAVSDGSCLQNTFDCIENKSPSASESEMSYEGTDDCQLEIIRLVNRSANESIILDSKTLRSSVEKTADAEATSKSMTKCPSTLIEFVATNGCPNSQSPSILSDTGSHDSGKGPSPFTGVTTASPQLASPISELIEIPSVYEFEVPQKIVGLIIGRHGITIRQFTEHSGAQIIMRHHYYNPDYKICTIEGSRDQINKCLRLMRHRFPPSRFPDLKLTPYLPPSVVCPKVPVVETMVALSLPLGVTCEVVLSSLLTAGHFFLQQPTHPTFPSLSRLDQYMLAVYSQGSGVPCLPKPIETTGTICVAPMADGWYRSETIQWYEDMDEVLVKFVDYGGYAKLPYCDLKQIRSDFLSLPFQAIECSLAHVKPIDDNEGWSVDATMFFEQCVHGQIAEAVLVKDDKKHALMSSVELYCTLDGETNMINRLLVENGYAVWTKQEIA